MRERLGQIVVRDHRGEPLAHQLVAAIARDVLRGVIDRGEAAVGVERHDRVGRGFDEVAIAGFGTRQRVLGALGVGDVTQRGDGADQLPIHAERPARDGDVALFVGAVIDDLRFVALGLAGQDLVLARGHVRTLGGSHLLGNRRAPQVGDRHSQQLRPGLVHRQDAAIRAGHHDRIGKRRHDVRGGLQQIQPGPLDGPGATRSAPGR